MKPVVFLFLIGAWYCFAGTVCQDEGIVVLFSPLTMLNIFFSVLHSSQVFICEPEIWSLLVADGGQLLIKCLLGALSREGDNDNCPRMVL